MIQLKSLLRSSLLYRVGFSALQIGLGLLLFNITANLEGLDSTQFTVKLLERAPVFQFFDFAAPWVLSALACLLGRRTGYHLFTLSQLWTLSRIIQTPSALATPWDYLIQIGLVLANYAISYLVFYSSFEQKRESERIPVKLICKIYRASELAIGRVDQLSRSGMFILTLSDLKPDEDLIIKISFHHAELILSAKVIHCAKSFRAQGYGLEFDVMDSANQKVFEEIWELLTENKKIPPHSRKSA